MLALFLGSLVSVYNFPVTNSLTPEEILSYAEEIFHSQNTAFRLQFSFGFIMYNSIQDRYRYFIPEDNAGYFDSPFRFSVANDLDRFYRSINSLDVFESLCKQKPSSAWKPVMLTNIRFSIFKTNFPLGSDVTIPEFIKEKKCIVSKIISRYSSKSHNLCLFMCLNYLRSGLEQLITKSHDLFDQWIEFALKEKLISKSISVNEFDGFDMKHIPYFEELFQVNVNIYEMNESDTVITIFKSIAKHQEVIHLNHFEGNANNKSEYVFE